MITGLTEEAHLKDALFQSENNDPIKHIHVRSLFIVIGIDFFKKKMRRRTEKNSPRSCKKLLVP